MYLGAPPLNPPAPLAVVEHVAALPPWVLLAYLASGVLFILALRGLSSPATSQRGNRFGMIGMGIAVVTTLLTQAPIPPGKLLPEPTPADLRVLVQILAGIGLGAPRPQRRGQPSDPDAHGAGLAALATAAARVSR